MAESHWCQHRSPDRVRGDDGTVFCNLPDCGKEIKSPEFVAIELLHRKVDDLFARIAQLEAGHAGSTNGAAGSSNRSPEHIAAPSNGEELLTAQQVQARWGKLKPGQKPKLVYRLAKAGDLPYVKLGRELSFRLTDVEAFESRGGVDGR